MRSRWRRFVERLLPWYDPEAERARNARTEAIRLRSIRARIESERVIDAYRAAPWPRRR
jgi:hypothetical protein